MSNERDPNPRNHHHHHDHGDVHDHGEGEHPCGRGDGLEDSPRHHGNPFRHPHGYHARGAGERWQRWHEFHHRCGRVRHFVGAHLHRQLFAWFGASILITGAVVMIAMRALNEGPSSWHTEVNRIERFVSVRYASVWTDPPRRDEFSRSIAHDLELGVRLRDAHGTVLSSDAMPDRCRWATLVPVRNGAVVLGSAEFCMDKHHPKPTLWRLGVPLLVAFSVLWAMSGKIARRLAGPLRELTRVTREIGEGNLASRSRLRHGLRGEVGQLSDAVNEMATRIERQVRDQRELLAAVSHELRTPLARVRILLEMARDGAGVKDPLGEIESEVLEMDSLVGDLLASSRIDFSAMAPRALSAEALAQRAIERASLPGARLEVDPRVGPVVADATLLSRALAALLDNAKKHGGSSIVLGVRPADEGDGIRFAVDDDGPGFAPGEEERALEPFHRGPERRPGESAGLGLGLSLVRRIAEAHGGRAFAGNRPEGGARVGFDLPARTLDA